MKIFNHIQNNLILTGTATLFIPFILLLLTGDFNIGGGVSVPYNYLIVISGLALILIGLFILYQTNFLFAKIGEGTLAPWSPPKNLVIEGIYQYVRNPMLTSFLLIILGETILLSSVILFLWLLFLFVVVHLYFVFLEEPELFKRFGDNYTVYKKNVPRWIPRLKPWRKND
ncbi:MAG: methyltransferase family protein [Candidatus Hodarchaeales archaeon]|jgi:protein-S-isoprenylcysteine O-methyltransferase Ste14